VTRGADHRIDPRIPNSVPHRIALVIAFLSTQLIMLAVLLGPIISQGWWRGFRGYFANDQLSYAAIAITASKGKFSPVEPLTETGTSHYPSAWYLFIGAMNGITNQPVYLLWTVLGLMAIGAGLAFLGWLAYRFSRIALAPLLPGLALLTGTLSMATSGWWFSPLSGHAVMWGPFGTLFALNAEAIGLLMITTAIGTLLLAQTRASRPHLLIIIAAFLIGALANIQTYSFLTGTSLAVIFTAVFAVHTYPSRDRVLASIGLLATLLLAGQTLAELIGPLPLFTLILMTALPAAWPLLSQQPRVTALVIGVYAIAASPQVIRTAVGLATGDDFLSYRQASTLDLGVQPGAALVAALPLLLIAAFTIMTLIKTQPSPERTSFRALLIALGFGALLMSTNDRWGFAQEPYRFWLQYSIITILLLSVTTAWSMRQWRELKRNWQQATAIFAACAVALWAFSLADVRSFFTFASDQGVVTVEDERGAALRTLIAPDTGLMLSSNCLDPQVLKLITSTPVAFFNRGLAWPDNRTEIDQLLEQEPTSGVDPQLLANIGITHVLTDSACAGDWTFNDARVQPASVQTYSGGLFTLCQVRAL